jgi:hypothetical protein
MKKLMTAVGIVILVFGILLATFTFIAFPKNKTEAYQIPESTAIVDRFGLLGPSFGVLAPTADWADGITLSAGDFLNIQVNVTSGQKIDFYVSDGSNGVNSNVGSSPYLFYPNVIMVNTDWIVPKNSSYNFVFSSSGTVSASDVHWQIVKLWNETDYRSVTQNIPLLPLQILYVGVGIALSGLAITVYGTRLKKDRLAV